VVLAIGSLKHTTSSKVSYLISNFLLLLLLLFPLLLLLSLTSYSSSSFETRESHMLGKHATTELYTPPFLIFIF
jgi:hypothetical protein